MDKLEIFRVVKMGVFDVDESEYEEGNRRKIVFLIWFYMLDEGFMVV